MMAFLKIAESIYFRKVNEYRDFYCENKIQICFTFFYFTFQKHSVVIFIHFLRCILITYSYLEHIYLAMRPQMRAYDFLI